MNHNSLSSNHESNGNHQLDDDYYNQWIDTMKGVEFQGGKAPVSMTSQETISTSTTTETQRKPIDKLEKLFGRIQGVKDFVESKLGIKDSEKLTEKADDALVYIAKETIAAADEDGFRTKTEVIEIEEAVSSVVVQGAMEEAGMERSAGKNPILELNQGDTQSDLMASIESLHEEGTVLPSGESIAGLATRTIERDKKWDLTKKSGPLGSNEGGWYEKPNGERFYVKFYKNPNQGRAEFVANAIYEKLGIKAVRSEIIHLDGREAIASPAIPNAASTNREAQGASKDVQKGFVADAFLANWDVVGLTYDNIVQNKDGFYRIDNGGSLIFRARGGDKVYSPDSIPELQSMRVRGRPAGEVFAGITEDEIGKQARELVSKLSPEDIRAIVDESGMDGKDRDRVLTGLLGRREYLVRAYEEPEVPPNPESRERRPRRSVSETMRMLSSKEMEYTGEKVIRPRTEIICDHDHIEGQRIDVIDKKDQGVMEFRFKLRTRTATDSLTMLELHRKGRDGQTDTITQSGATLTRGQIKYDWTSSSKDPKILCDATVLEKNGVKVFIADPSSRYNGDTINSLRNDSHLIQTAVGLVKAEVPSGMNPEVAEQTLGEILEKDLGIQDALGEVSEEAEKEYKIARYKWQHMITEELTPEQIKQAEKLEREEVFPGYTTLVERGKHEEYLEKYGKDVRAIHRLSKGGDPEIVYSVLTQGLMCTTERFSRGINNTGKSSDEDIDTGGADSVFTRISNKDQRMGMEGVTIVFKPEIFDRTDWYSYDQDQYGSTSKERFTRRLSPDAILAEATGSNAYITGNEEMFRTGIGAEYIESIQIGSTYYRDEIITKLQHMGLEEVGGRPIEDIIVLSKTSSSEYMEEQKQKQAEDQVKLQALINGDEHYTSVQEMINLAYTGGNFGTSLKLIVDSIVAQGGKEQLASDMAEYLISAISLEDLKMLTEGVSSTDYSDDDKEVLSYLQNTLGIDYNALYEEALKSQSGMPP